VLDYLGSQKITKTKGNKMLTYKFTYSENGSVGTIEIVANSEDTAHSLFYSEKPNAVMIMLSHNI
jgi:hypothetical protein